jgi:hypothetical protein
MSPAQARSRWGRSDSKAKLLQRHLQIWEVLEGKDGAGGQCEEGLSVGGAERGSQRCLLCPSSCHLTQK